MIGNREESNNCSIQCNHIDKVDSRENTKRMLIGEMKWEFNKIREVTSTIHRWLKS